MLNALTIDVEEYFHPTEVQSTISQSDWDGLPSRVEAQVERILATTENLKVKATFFVLGWVAERHPCVVRAIHAAGHEIGCHSYWHRLVYDLSPEEFRRDTQRAVAAIQDACGATPRVYRAPSYSITSRSLWALEILVEEGFTHDSSIFPVSHDRYGIPGFERHARSVETKSGPLLEVPVATVQVGKTGVVPVGGGGYLRLLPYRYTAAGIRRVNRDERQPACIYFHPWELDPDQPRLPLKPISRLRTYTGLHGMSKKLDCLLRDFRFGTLSEVYPVAAGERKTFEHAVSVGNY
jgi:polysaccharide deacetylase family protein (PEP-CTERM system associated)